MKTKIKFLNHTTGITVPKEYISGVSAPYDSRFLRVLKKGNVPKEVHDAAEKYREVCENTSYIAKLEILDHIKVAQERELDATEKEIECLSEFIDELSEEVEKC